jgi:secreted Zn-dependent insulinase-like peptidase
MREISYMAELAGNQISYFFGADSLKFSHVAYNDNYEKFLQEFLSQVQNFDTTEEYFNDIKNAKLRAYKNAMIQEPY